MQLCIAGHRVLSPQWIQEIDAAVYTHTWSVRVLKHVECLRFAVAWADLTGAGSTSFKRDFYIRLFASSSDDVHARIMDDDVGFAEIPVYFANEFKTWKRAQEKVVTARNRLMQLYHCVNVACDCCVLLLAD